MKKMIRAGLMVVLLAMLLAICFGVIGRMLLSRNQAERYGSFTIEKTFSHDGRYYALVEPEDGHMLSRMIRVSVHEAASGELIAEFRPARALDFWGICWESDSYNIWIQSADIGIFCYRYEDGMWIEDWEIERPADIISKYDE